MTEGSEPRAVRQGGDGRASAQDDRPTRTAIVPDTGEVRSGREVERDAIAAGQRIGRYTVLGLIGVGGMGQVCSAYDPKLDRRVALKLLHTQGSEVERDRLRREARALARLAHPNVVTVHEVDEHDGRLLVAMEQVDGETLKEWLQAHPPDGGAERLRAALELLTQAGRGLAAAHASGLVHRDFKPANVLVGRDARVRVVDFGLARTMPTVEGAGLLDSVQDADEGLLASHNASPEETLTETGMIAGTPAYMAPEQFLGEHVDGKSDQFSFCVAAWEVLFGERPFAGGDRASVIAAIRGGRVRRPESADVPPLVETALRKGLSLRPKQRHESMAALLEQLEAARATLAGERAPAKPSRRGWAVAAGVLLVVGLGFAGRRLFVARLEQACRDQGDAIDGVWNDAFREAVRASLIATGATYAPTVAEKVVPWLDDQAEAWREHATAACMRASVDGKWDAAQLDKAQWCLEQRRLELSALVDELMRADRDVVQNAIVAASSLARVDGCVLDSAVATMVEPPSAELRPQAAEVLAEISRANSLERLGSYAAGLEVATAATSKAERLGWPPLTAAARAGEANLFGSAGDFSSAEDSGVAAFMEAVRAGAWDVAADAAIELAFLVGHKRRRAGEGRLWAEHAAVVLSRSGDPLGLREAARLNAVAAIAFAGGAYGEAKKLHERVLMTRERALGPEHPTVAVALRNLALVRNQLGEVRDARTLATRAVEITSASSGPDHPRVAEALSMLCKLDHDVGAFEDGKSCWQRVLSIDEVALGPEHPTVANDLHGLAIGLSQLGDHAAAKRNLERALSLRQNLPDGDGPVTAGVLLDLGAVNKATGDYEAAKAYDERALAIFEKTLPADHPSIAMALSNLGQVHYLLRDYAAAKRAHERALAIKEVSLGKDHPDVAFALNGLGEASHALGDHRAAIEHLSRAVALRSGDNVAPTLRAYSEWALAKALYDAPPRDGRDRTRARTLATRARDTFATAGQGFERDRDSLDAWLREHPL
ncbi:MAG: serine/threonine protein kinase [Deltaproteobacteria bacterium]|nr:serine/threonine protein kinase [Deltaproteobacteria bacterium]MBP7289155.1 serine/threonine protein kinase [Nannocystaceae bacterium]